MSRTAAGAVLSLYIGGATALQLSAVRPVSVVRPVVERRVGCDIICGWGPDPVWAPNKIESIGDASDGLKAITIVPPTNDDFTIPGQYLQIKEPGAEKAGIFAIASAPDKKGAFEFLIKEQPPSDWSPGTGWLTSAPAGTELEMSQVMGPGFKCTGEALDGVTDVLLFAVGSGISPVRSVIESGVLKGKSVSLYYGAQTPKQMAYMDKFAEWEKLGVKVTPVISQADGTDWDGATGYVQDVAKTAGVASPSSTVMLICGMKGMAEGVKALAAEVGVPEENVRANF